MIRAKKRIAKIRQYVVRGKSAANRRPDRRKRAGCAVIFFCISVRILSWRLRKKQTAEICGGRGHLCRVFIGKRGVPRRAVCNIII